MTSTFKISAPKDLHCQIVINGTVGEMIAIQEAIEQSGHSFKDYTPPGKLWYQLRDIIRQAHRSFVCEQEDKKECSADGD